MLQACLFVVLCLLSGAFATPQSTADETMLLQKHDLSSDILIVQQNDTGNFRAVKANKHTSGKRMGRAQTHASLSQVAVKESPDCSEFMTEISRNSGAQIGGQAVAEGADGALSLVGDMSSTALAKGLGSTVAYGFSSLAGPFGAMIGGTIAEMFLPDPNNARIEKLENGMVCLHEKVVMIEEDINKLKHEQEIQNRWISTLSQIPLKRKISKAKLLLAEHKLCAKLMRCVKSGTKSLEDCQEQHGQFVKHCDAAAFSLQALGSDAYHFLKEGSTNAYNQMVPIELAKQEMWSFARDFVVEYLALFLSMHLLWNSLEEWAVTLCTESCLDEEKMNIKLGFHAFKNSIITQASDAEVLSRKMEEAEKNGMEFGKSSLNKQRSLRCQLIPHDDTDRSVELGEAQPLGIGKPNGHDDKHKMTVGKWQAREWTLDCPERDSLQDMCEEKPCTIESSLNTLITSAGCSEREWPGNCDKHSISEPNGECGLFWRRKEFYNNDENWAYDVGIVCPDNVRDKCWERDCWEFSYIEYHNELRPYLHKLEQMAGLLKTRRIVNPPYREAVNHWAISGSWSGSRTGYSQSEEHWAKDTRVACLKNEMKTDPWKHKKMGTTCCDGLKGIREPRCTEHVTFEESRDSCEANGWRLCSANELTVGVMGEKEGCGFDQHLIWSSDMCPYENDTLITWESLGIPEPAPTLAPTPPPTPAYSSCPWAPQHACGGDVIADLDLDRAACVERCGQTANCFCVTYGPKPNPCRLETGTTHSDRNNPHYSALAKSVFAQNC